MFVQMIVGASSHICLWEGGNAAGLAGVSVRQVQEDEVDATMPADLVRDCFVRDDDDHTPKTELVCLENTHNMLGGVVLPPSYMDAMSRLVHEEGIRLHMDGARIFNAIAATDNNTSPSDMCRGIDSVSICLSKGLGAPLGSVLVGETETIRLAKRARKRCGGGMRQAGIVAAMGLYAVQNNAARLVEDGVRAQRLGKTLVENGFVLPREGRVDTNIVFFELPSTCTIPKEEFTQRLQQEHGVLITGGYSRGGKLFRVCTHMDVNDEDVDRATEAIVQLGLS